MKKRLALLFVSIFAMGVTAYSAQAEDNILKGVVKDASGQEILKAAVYLIPSSDVEAMGKTTLEVKRNSPNDEPLEDNLAANIDKYKNASTDKKGNFKITGIPDGKYFIYVMPSDKTYLPGGDKSNKSMLTSEFKGKTINLLLSGNIPDNAVYVGSSKCLTCHAAYGSLKKTLHKLGISVVGKPGKLQDYSRFPDFNSGLNKLLAGTKFYFYNFYKNKGFHKYIIS